MLLISYLSVFVFSENAFVVQFIVFGFIKSIVYSPKLWVFIMTERTLTEFLMALTWEKKLWYAGEKKLDEEESTENDNYK